MKKTLTKLRLLAFLGMMSVVSAWAEGNVAKIGDVEYATIEEAIGAWGPGKTLTLLANVTTTSTVVVEVNATKSTQNWTLDLGDYTWTASGCNAFQLYAAGGTVMNQNYGLKIYANQNGGITASGKYCIECKYDNSTAGYRPRLEIHGGTYSGSNIIYYASLTYNNNSISNGPSTWFYKSNDGSEPVFNGNFALAKCPITINAGYFNGTSFNTYPVTSTANTNIYGGHFKSINAYPSNSNSKNNVYGNYKIFYKTDGSIDVVNGAPATYEASTTSSSAVLGSAKATGYPGPLYFESANDAIQKYNIPIKLNENVVATQDKTISASATLTIDATAEGSSYTGNVVLANNNAKLVMIFPEGGGHYGVSVNSGTLHVVETVADGIVTRTYSRVSTISNPEAKVGSTNYSTVYDAFYAIDGTTDNKTIVLQRDVTNAGIVTNGTAVNTAGKTVATFDLNGKSIGIGSVAAGNNADYTLTIIDSSEGKTGTVTNSDASLFILALTGISDYSGSYTLKVQAGTWQFDPSAVNINGEIHNLVDEGYVARDNENGTWTVVETTRVAKIGTTKYSTLQAAVDAAQQMGGAVTVEIINDISGETVTIKEVANFQLTIDGKKDDSSNYTVDARIVIDGLRGNGGSNTNGASVTLQNIAFVNSSSSDGIQPKGYPHHLTIQDCTYTGSSTSSNKWFVNVTDGPLYGATIKNVTVENTRLIQGNLGLDVVFENITATNNTTVGFQIKTEGTVLIKDCQVTTAKYAFRDIADEYEGTIILEDNTFTSTSEESDEGVIVNRSGKVGSGQINVVSGTYTGHVKVLNNEGGVLAISGGYFSEEFPQEYIAADLVAEGKVCVPATDMEGYFTIGDPHYVAQIGEVKYKTLTEAVNAAQSGETIELLDDITTETGNKSLKAGVTLDGKGKTISGDIAIYISKDGGTVQNVNFKNIHNASNRKSAIYSEYLEGTATITGCTFDNCDWDAIQIIPVAGANVVITNNVFSDDTEDGITQKRYIHVQSAENVDFSATITENVMLGNNGGPMDIYYPTDKTKLNLTNNYIEVVDDNLCILLANDDGFAGELAFPAYTTADKEETYSPEAYVQNDQYSAKFYMTFAEAATAAGNDKVVSLVTNVTDPYVMSEGQILKVKKNGKTFNKPKGPDGFEVKDKTTDGVTTYTLVEADIEYTTLAGVVSYKAWSNTVVSGSGTYKLLKDITASARIVPGISAADVTLDLNGHTLTSTASDNTVLLSRNGTASAAKTFSIVDTSTDGGGKIVANTSANAAIMVTGDYNEVTIGEGVTIDGNCVAITGSGSNSADNCKLTVNGTINGGDDFAIATNGSLTKNATININDGAVLTSNVTAVYLPGTGTTNISGGTITGSNGIYVKSGELNITGGEITGNGETAEFVHNPNGTSIVGAALVVENCSYPGGAPKVNVTGGTFTSANADAIASYSYGDGNEPIGQFVHGGYFSTELPRELCEAGKRTVPSTTVEGYYELGEVVFVAQIGDVKYETLADAVAAVPAGMETTITMIANEMINVTGYAVTIPATKNIILDLNGYQVVGTVEQEGTSALIRNLGTLTIKDSSDTNKDGSGTGKLMSGASPTWTWDGSDDYSGSYASNLIRNEKNLIVESGYLYNMSTGSAAYAIDNYSAGNVTINGGKVDAAKASAIRMYYVNGGSITVNDGIIGHYNSDDDCTYMGIQVMSGTNVNVSVNGGTIVGNYAVYANNTGGNINISGGTYDGYVGFAASVPNIEITGGAFNYWVGTWGDQTKFISGGIYAEEVDAEYIADGFILTNNTDPATKDDYPYAVKQGAYVAQIGDVKYETLEAAIEAATAGQTITLLADIDTEVQIEVGKQVTLDLNGKTIEYKGSATLSSGVIMVLRGGDLTVTDSSEDATGAIKSGTKAYAAIILTKAGETSTETAKLTVNGGTLEGYYYAITGNGNRHGTEITINGGVLRGTAENDNLGIFHPQDGTLTINGGTISGYSSGVEMRSGTLNVTGGTITATADSYSYSGNGSGNTTTGAAIAIAQHNTGKDITANITGATLSGTKLISVVDTQNNNLENVTVTASDDYIENTAIPADFKWVSNDNRTSTLKPTKFVFVDGEDTCVFTEDYPGVEATYIRSFDSSRTGKYQGWFLPFDYEITDGDLEKFDFFEIGLIAHSPVAGSTEVTSEKIWIHLNKLTSVRTLNANYPYVFKPKEVLEDYEFKAEETTVKANVTERVAYCSTMPEEFNFYGVYDSAKPTVDDPFYYMNYKGQISWGSGNKLVTVGAFRWIIRVVNKNNGTPTSGAREILFVEDGNEETAIHNIQKADDAEAYYTLDGVKVQHPGKGVYLKKSADGKMKKVFIK